MERAALVVGLQYKEDYDQWVGGVMNKRIKMIILSLLLIFILGVGGVSLFYSKTSKIEEDSISEVNGVNETSEVAKEELTGTNAEPQRIKKQSFHYEESLLSDELRDFLVQNILATYNDLPVKVVYNNDNWLLKDLENNKLITNTKIENSTQFHSYTIKESLWSVEYDKASEDVFVNNYSLEGNLERQVKLLAYPALKDEYGIEVAQLRVSDNNLFLLAQTTKRFTLLIYDLTGHLLYEHQDIISFDIDRHGNYVCSVESNKDFPYTGIFKFNIKDGKEIFRNESLTPQLIRYDTEKNKLYALTDKIKEIDPNTGAVVKDIIEVGVDTTYLLDDYTVTDFTVAKDKTIYISLENIYYPDRMDFKDFKSRRSMYQYDYVESPRQERETTVVLTVPYRSDLLTEAIKRYELKNPKEHVVYDYEYSSYDEFKQNSNEYGKKLALRIMTGEVGDIVQSGGSSLDFLSIARTDVFMDLDSLIKDVDNYGDLNEEIIEAVRVNNAIRAIPINYNFYCYEYNEDLAGELGLQLDTDRVRWSDILDLIPLFESKAPTSNILIRWGGGNFWTMYSEPIINVNMPDLVNIEEKSIELNQKWFKDLLIQIKALKGHKNLILKEFDYNLYDKLHGALLAPNASSIFYYSDAQYHYREYNKSNRSTMIPMIQGEKSDNRFGYSKYMYSINERSKRKESAWKFLSFLLSEEIQNIASKYGTPVNTKAINNMMRKARRDSGFRDEEVPESIIRYEESYISNSKKIINLYDYTYMKRDLILALNEYMDDKITLEEALQKAEDSILIRLNE